MDGGGTYTRALVADLTGRVLGRAESGPANPDKTPCAAENVQQAIRSALAQAGKRPAQVAALVVGIAGLDRPEDQEWAERFGALPGLACSKQYVNDAVVAHAGALGSRPGVIAIAGTGSIVFAVTPEGRHLRNFDFRHYAYASARHLGYELMHRLIAGEAGPEDTLLLTAIHKFWNTRELDELRELGANGFVTDDYERIRRFGALGPLVTEAAWNNSPLAQGVCRRAGEALVTGIRLVGGGFGAVEVPVALIGGAARSRFMQQAVQEALDRYGAHPYRLAEPLFSCAAGAVLMALQAAGVVIDAGVQENLRRGGD